MMDFSIRRVGALMLRHLYIMRGSLPRVLEMVYWPALDMILWGLTSRFLAESSAWVAQMGGVLVAGVLLWNVMFRGNLGIALSFMEEVWSRNLGHLAVSPLRPHEMVAGMMAMSLIRTMIGVMPAILIAIPLYHFSLFDLGLPLLAFWVNLMVCGWAIGLGVSALVLRFGQGVESLAWVLIFAVVPVSAVYYPVSTLPVWLQWVAWSLPPAYIFEGMRAVLAGQGFRLDLLFPAMGLNVLYLGVAAGIFLYTHRVARERGLLLNLGE